ncbi:hypothetical protein [Bacteroides uniformis]|uniref:hypothetical protein n=1 Tax=Bacteroides uniformis TaxID=820 RepID=UPI002166B663|nr:hypothetical protein [Bacteroides uniformis]MCS2412409.1 hypothetical protein [Bacteroides uniformis]
MQFYFETASFFISRQTGNNSGSDGKDDVFPFLQGKGLGLHFLCKAALRARLAGKNHPRCAPVFFPPSLATKNGQSKGMKPVKSGKTIPMGLFI